MLILLFFNVSFLLAQEETKNGTLVVTLTDFEESGKYVQVGLYNAKANWLKKTFKGEVSLVEEGKTKVVFKDLPQGKYAISCFYDLNGNTDLDTGFMGVPNEPYAFSNNATALFGAPSWRKASFSVDSNEKRISIKF